MSNYAYLNYMEDLFLNTASLYSWHLTPEYDFSYSNHPDSAPLKNIFSLSSCNTYMKQHFQSSMEPVFLFDDFFFLWAAVPAYTEQKKLVNIHLLGPVFSSYTSDSYIKEKMDIQNMSVKSKTELLSLIDQIPVLPTAFLSHYVCQLYYTLNDALITVNDIKLQENPMSQSKEKEEDFTASEHSPYYYETLLSQSVQDGIPFSDFSNQISSAQVGTMCPGDPLRQKKDEGIGLVTIFTRAAIQGGISFEKAYTCSDYYIQSIEAASNITEVIQLIETMYFDITNQVHEATLSAIKNPMIRECITYLDTHYREKINLEELANTLGYTKYYLSTCFKKETGVSISEWIMEKRIAYAKLMLKNPSIDMQEISDELCFANPSHFSAVFKKMTGLTPTQYRNE